MVVSVPRSNDNSLSPGDDRHRAMVGLPVDLLWFFISCLNVVQPIVETLLLRQALEDKQQGVEPLMAEIDALDSQMTALEAMLERLDTATSQLNDKIAAANSSSHV